MLIILYGLFAGIMIMVSYLQDIPMGHLGYGLVISGFIGSCYLVFHFVRYYYDYQKLYLSAVNLKYSLRELPHAKTQMDELYQQMLEEIVEERSRLYRDMKYLETESNDYYTMWIHQIKTPIAAMRLLLQSKNNTNKQLLMEQELFQIEQYAEMALHYLRLHNTENDFVLKENDVYDIVKQALKKYSVTFIEKKLSLDFREFHHVVVTDEKWLEFVIEQILSNAVKYTSRGGIQITFSEENGGRLIITDSGIGINEADLPRIFEKGFTGYNGHMDKRSTGIGLYLCRQVVEKLQISIHVDSKPGEGTSVVLAFEKLIKD